MGRAKDRRLRAGPLLASTAVVTILGLAGCASSHEQRISEASDDLRDTVDRLTKAWNAGGAPSGTTQEQLRDRLAGASTSDLTFDTDPTTSRTETGVAHHARAESGGGLWYKATVIRLCVRYTVADDGSLQAGRTPCPAGLEPHTPLGTVSLEIEL